MASSLLALLDDIASVLDDIGVLSQVAARKTAGVLGDDLALNAQQVTGVRADREWPVVWAVARGSLVNKAVLVPAALAISAWAPWAIAPLLMVGGAYLCFEGVEKLAHRWLHAPGDEAAHREALTQALTDAHGDLLALERDKIRGAVRTDIVLSAEILAITLGTVAGQPLGVQAGVLSAVAVAMTVGVYGIVAAIVKLDDLGLYLSGRGPAQAAVGRALLRAAPALMKLLSVVGTAAMFLVGGGIIAHGWHGFETAVARIGQVLPALLSPVWSALADAALGVAVGAIVLGAVTAVQRLRRNR